VNIKKLAARIAGAFIVISIVLCLTLLGFFYSVFYFPNWSRATPGTIISSGEKRQYLLYVPKSYDSAKPAPLVVTLHTSMSWSSSAMAISRWNEVADENGFIVVYPEGSGFGSKTWEMAGSEAPARMPDVVFISNLIDKLESAYNIDKTRIYANGMSNGGGMAFVLSCTMSSRIAAVGMVSAGIDPEWSWCTDRHPVPVIAFHGTADPICPYDGGPSKLAGGSFPSVRDFYGHWSQRNQCRLNPVESPVAGDVTRLQYSDCADESDVTLYTIKGEGHQWPGGKPIKARWLVGAYSSSIDATRLMWTFFRSHQLAAR
jgi:polyhydroxybutyrate depolymerase